ncbi:MAG TPA: ATP-binding protein [Burkholderiaceae bacterium]|nr:ATP-binding protein [Burkholderiaceae bacterium]
MRVRNWAATPFGPVEHWPASLKTAAGLVLEAPTPMALLWGPALIEVGNNALCTRLDRRVTHENNDPKKVARDWAWAFDDANIQAAWRGESVRQTHRAYELERQGQRQTVWFDIALSPVRDDSARIAGILIALEDSKTPTQDDEPTARLQQLLNQRTAELARAEDALLQAQKMEAVGQLTGGIAHDFNNLLQAMQGNLELIRRKPNDEMWVRRWAENALAAARRGARLTMQLLNFSRSQELELEPLIVGDLISDMRDLLARTLGPTVTVRLDLDPTPLPILGDATQLELALLNLAINARDAMPNGGELLIRTALRAIHNDPELPGDEYMEITVTDNGTGMSPEVLAHAFDPFFTTKSVGKGTGLGLSQVYSFARQAGGLVRIASTQGEGTTVTLFLRRADDEARITPRENASASDDMRPVRSAKVLVVDDDPGVRRFLGDSLKSLGYRVVEAGDGIRGLEALDRELPDLLLVDFAMPGMNGAEVARTALDRCPDLPIVFSTGYADTPMLDEAMPMRLPVLRKPFGVDELAIAVRSALSR